MWFEHLERPKAAGIQAASMELDCGATLHGTSGCSHSVTLSPKLPSPEDDTEDLHKPHTHNNSSTVHPLRQDRTLQQKLLTSLLRGLLWRCAHSLVQACSWLLIWQANSQHHSSHAKLCLMVRPPGTCLRTPLHLQQQAFCWPSQAPLHKGA